MQKVVEKPLVLYPKKELVQENNNRIIKHLDDGSIELIVLGMLAALIVLLAIPLFSGFPEAAEEPTKNIVEAPKN